MTKYLMFDHGGVLDGQISSIPPGNNDLLISTYPWGKYQILKNGVNIVKNLHRLVNECGYKIVFHSKNKLEDQSELLEQLIEACESKGIKFPKIHGLAVCDPQMFPSIKANEALVFKNEVGILMACYGVDQDGKACVRAALSRLLKIDEKTRSQHIVFDDGKEIIRTARAEGYTAFQISPEMLNSSLDFVVQELLPKPSQTKLFGAFFKPQPTYRDPGKSEEYYAILDLKESLDVEIKSCLSINVPRKIAKAEFLKSILKKYDDENGRMLIRDCVLAAKNADENAYNVAIQGVTSRGRNLLESIIHSKRSKTYGGL